MKEDQNNQEEAPETRRPKRDVKKPAWMNTGEFIVGTAYYASSSGDPETYQEAINSSEREHWVEAMEDEMSSLFENDTWELVDIPEKTKVIDNRWVFRTKRNAEGNVQNYRARLVARGLVQKAGVDYNETFSPVARYETIRSVLPVSAQDLHLYQFDVKTAFLYSDIEEEVYMTQPKGFDDGSGRVCKLKRCIYGLKQAPRCWNKKFSNLLRKQGLKVSENNPCPFIRNRNKRKLIVTIFVGDGLVAGTSKEEIMSFLNELREHFKITSDVLIVS